MSMRARARELRDKALRCFLALLMAVSSFVGITRPAEAYADTSGYLSVGGDIYYGGWSTTWFDVDGNMAYCGDPSSSTPSGGWYEMSGVGDESVAAALWYGYGGPGFDASMWPSTWYDGSGMDAGKYAALTHIVLADLWAGDGHYAYGQCSSDFIDWCQWNVVGYSIDDGSLLNSDAIRVRLGWNGFGAGSAGSWPSGFEAYYMGTGSGTQCILTFKYNPSGWVDLVKASSNDAISGSDGCYSLAGAQYGVFSDSGCTQRVDTLATNGDGYAKSSDLAAGTYWVKEVSAAPGYALDGATYAVTVQAGQTARVNGDKVYDSPKSDPVGMLVAKADADLGGQPQGAASLAGAEFTVSFYKGDYASADQAEVSGAAERTWVFATDADGFAYYSDEYKVSGDDFYYQSDGKTATMPLGTAVIQETKAPEGYVLDDGAGGEPRKFCVRITDDGTLGESVYTYNSPESPDSVIRGGVEVRKADDTTGDDPQGDARLDGAVLDIVTLSDNPVVVDGNTFSKGDVVKSVTVSYDKSEKAYIASCADCLPYGSYEVHEAEAPEGYLLNPDWSREFQVTYDGQVANLTTDADALPDSVVRGGVMVNKADTATDVTYAVNR